MSGAAQMTSGRRRMPGMTGHTGTPEPSPSTDRASEPSATGDGRQASEARVAAQSSGVNERQSPASAPAEQPIDAGSVTPDLPAVDYASTRLVNFRIPVAIHDRFRDLVQDTERAYPRLRRPSLTELVIALLEQEGPETADEVAELIRRKRAREHAEI